MARHEVIIHQNTGATAENAPYLGSYIAKETVPQETFVESVAAKCGLPAIQVAAIIDGSFETIEELERAGLVRVRTDLGVVCGVTRSSTRSGTRWSSRSGSTTRSGSTSRTWSRRSSPTRR